MSEKFNRSTKGWIELRDGTKVRIHDETTLKVARLLLDSVEEEMEKEGP